MSPVGAQHRRPTRSLRRLAVSGAMLCVVATGAGCTSKQKVAREQFASAAGCPFDEVTAVERSDLSAYDMMAGAEEPSADIASDPARVRLWRENQARTRKANDASTTVYLVSGCQKKKFYGCSRGTAKQGSNVSCSTLDAREP